MAVTVCVELLGAVGVAAAPSPTASPCGQGLAGVVCTVGGAAPPGGLSPAPQSSPTAAPPAPAARRPAPAAAPATARPPAPPPGPTPSPDASLSMVAASLRSAPYVGQLLDVLAHPVASTRPDLRHFQPPNGGAAAALAAGGGPAGGADPSRGGGRGVVLLELLFAALVVALPLRRGFGLLRAHAAGGWRPALPALPPPRPGWLLAAALAVVVPVSTDASLTALATRHHPAAPAHPPAAAAPPAPAPVSRAAAAPSPGAPTAWSRLVGIERRLSDETGLLAQQEWEIRRLASVVGRHLDDPDQVPVGAASTVQERARLGGLLSAHQVATAAYHRDLQAEYDLYRSAAGDPGQRAQLTAGAAAAPSPEAPVAVTSNLGLVATQLAQEAALADAQARLHQLGALLPAQVAAIRRHLPFITPEVAPVSQGFGPTDLGIEPPISYQGTFYPHFHTGIDLAAPSGTPLHAAADGVVLIAAASADATGRLVGYGNYVVVGHAAGFLTLYGHMSDVAVHGGDRVRQGEVIGYEGSTGNSTGPHVHFEIRKDGTLLDPAPFLVGQLPPG
ncbi:MAG TPA: M23 family metallopeptidase [Candidatus Dormibacteraeota bacterium]|nr:M23 family metallopeptidase [Candidatus Dormibacteraeota bacterium]